MENEFVEHVNESGCEKSEKPWLLVDVDGVLAPFGKGGFHNFDGRRSSDDTSVLDRLQNVADYEGYEFNRDHLIHVSPDNSRRLKQLSDKFELAWCTGWQEGANEVIAPLHGLPKLPVVRATGSYNQIHWKLDWIEAFVGDRPYAFIDDDISDLALTYSAWRDANIPTLWLPIKCSVGLTDEHVEELEDFAERAVCSVNASE